MVKVKDSLGSNGRWDLTTCFAVLHSSLYDCRSPTESRKRHEEKQAKAEAMRKKLLQEKAERLSTLTGKVSKDC